MKVLFVLILFLSMEQTFSQTVFQTAQEQRTDSVAQLVKKYYNTKQTDSLYALTGKAFKEKVPLSALEQGLLTQLAPYGAITLFEFVNSKNGVSRYKTKLLGGLTLQTLIGLDSDGYMQTFAMQPWRDESAPKRTTLYSDNPMVSELDSAVDKAARSYMMDTVTAGLSISVHVNGKDYFYNYGETDKSTRQKPSSETVYEIGSITKTFTGYLLAKAVSEKKVKLTDPITLYLPDSVASNPGIKNIQLVHLANHTSGLPRLPVDLYNAPGMNRDDPYAHYNEKLLFNGLAQIKPLRQPGEQYEYSNYAMGLLGCILAGVYKIPYPDLVEKHMLIPMKMGHSTAGNSLPSGTSIGYNEKGQPASYWKFDALAAAGSIKSNASDLLTYGKIMMLSFLEKSAVSFLLTTPTWNNPPQVVTLGWHRTLDDTSPVIYQHGGGTNGFRSQLIVCPEQKWVIVALANHGADPGASAVAEKIAAYLKK